LGDLSKFADWSKTAALLIVFGRFLTILRRKRRTRPQKAGRGFAFGRALFQAVHGLTA